MKSSRVKTINYLTFGAIFIALFFVGATHVSAYTAGAFVTTWKTDNLGTSNNTSITIPTTGGGYNYDVDWDNNGTFEQTGITGNVTHNFGVAGTYTIQLRGTFPRIFFNAGGDRRKILFINQWGNIAWTSMADAFDTCQNLDITAVDVPDLSNVTSMSEMFESATSLSQNINSWNVSHVTNMNALFYNADSFNQPLDSWDVSHVTTMRSMFESNDVFNQDISSWDVSNVTDMRDMFNITSFNQDISSWDVSHVTNMLGIFGNSPFNQDISSWDVGSVTDMTYMFTDSSFNQDISSWDVSHVASMASMFTNSPFNQDISSWDVSNVGTMTGMFYGTSFNQDISSWDVSNTDNMNFMFYNDTSFNQDISSWDVSKVEGMAAMFSGATSFDQDLSLWDVSHVTDMTDMFLDVTLSTTYYDGMLQEWSFLPLQSNVTFGAGNSMYYCATSRRQSLIDDYNWTISDGGLDGVSHPCAPKIYYSPGNYLEPYADNGTLVGNGTATVANDTFVNAGSTLTLNTHYSLSLVPAGLTPIMSVSGDGSKVTLTFSGSATSSDPGDNVPNLTITFLDGAFTDTPLASDVENHANNESTISFIDHTFNGTTILYGIDGSDFNADPPNLFTINPDTGEKLSTVGPVGYYITGMAFNPETKILYGVSGEQSSNAKSLFTIDTDTGAGSLLGDLEDVDTNPVLFLDLAFRSDGTLYGFNRYDNGLYTIDVSSCNGADDTVCLATKVGNSLPVSGGDGLALSFDSMDDLYLFANTDSSFYQVDPDVGEVIDETTFSPSGSGYPISSATYDGNNTLFASRLNFGSSPADLVTIDTSLGTITSLGDETDMIYMDALAFYLDSIPTISEVTPITTPTTDTTPDYTFTTDEAGDITYGGSCASITTSATIGANTITFDPLAIGTYSDCTITVTDDTLNDSNVLSVTSFTIEAEPELEPSHHVSASGYSFRESNFFANSNTIIPANPNNSTPKDCVTSYLFSPSTGQACPKFQFFNNLSLNMVHPDVLELQKYLNAHNYILTSMGAGSLGHETYKFGGLTQKALIKFQIANHITPAVGFFGPTTRGVVNSSI